jgi:hypothetical protein
VGEPFGLPAALPGIEAIYHLLEKGTFYDEAYYQPLQARQEHRQKNRALKLLEQLGYHVTLEPVT